MNTSTTMKNLLAAINWLEINIRYLRAFGMNTPVMQAASHEYKQKFNRDLAEDLAEVKRSQNDNPHSQTK